MPTTAKIHIYGALDGKPLEILPTQLLSGQTIEGFLIFPWWGASSKATK